MVPSQPEPSTAVYSWYMPEIAQVVSGLAKHDYPTEAFRSNYSPGLDGFHDSLLDAYRNDSLFDVFDSTEWDWEAALPNRYYTNGSSEALFHLIVRHKVHFPNIPLYIFSGEYQGYQEFAQTVGANLVVVDHGRDLNSLIPGVFIISVPSAVDGNVVASSAIDKICERHYVIIDCAYAGMAEIAQKLKLNDRIAAVVGSMSKPFGLYYHRIGFVWAKDPIDSLYGNKWFKNIFSIVVGTEVLGDFSARDLAAKYRPWQKRACTEVSTMMGIEIVPSDVWLLGHYFQKQGDVLPFSMGPFKRGPVYRICLTPYYMAYENENA